jgi:hypothetical protein
VKDREADISWFTDFVVNSRWQFAKTYVESFPHEYTLKRWCDVDAFGDAILCIEHWGVMESFFNTQRKYLHVDDRKYWHMGSASSDNAADRPTLINRTWRDVSRYREDAKALGYAEAALDKLVARWNLLLEMATHIGEGHPRNRQVRDSDCFRKPRVLECPVILRWV